MTKDASPVTENIHTAILSIQSDLPVVAKRRTADTGKYKYSYADIADLTAAVMPRLKALEVIYTCHPEIVLVNGSAEQSVRGCLTHVPTLTEVHGVLMMKGSRTNQEVGSSLTYYRRYLLGCLTGVLTDDDEDGTIASKVQGETVEAEILAATTPEEIESIAKDRGLKQGGKLYKMAIGRYEQLKAASQEVPGADQ